MNDSNLSRYRSAPQRFDPPLELDPQLSTTGVLRPPLVVDDIMYLSRTDASVEAREVASGRELWRWRFGGEADTSFGSDSGTLAFTGEHLLAEFGDQLIVLDRLSGRPLSSNQLGGATLLGAALSPTDVYQLRVDDDLRCSCRRWDFLRQSVRWETAIDGFVEHITCHDGLVLLAPNKDRCLALNASDGAVVWESELADLSLPPEATHAVERVAITSAIVPIGERCVLGLSAAHLVALSRESGTVDWVRQFSCDSDAGFFTYYVGGEVFLLSGPRLYRVDPVTGVPSSVLEVEAALSEAGVLMMGQPAVCEGFVYVGCPATGCLAAIDVFGGSAAWSYACRASIPVSFEPVVAGSRLFVVDAERTLYAFRSVS